MDEKIKYIFFVFLGIIFYLIFFKKELVEGWTCTLNTNLVDTHLDCGSLDKDSCPTYGQPGRGQLCYWNEDGWDSCDQYDGVSTSAVVESQSRINCNGISTSTACYGGTAWSQTAYYCFLNEGDGETCENDGRTMNLRNSYSNDTGNCYCNPGYYRVLSTNRECTQCPAGRHKTNPGNDTSCSECPVGTFSSAGASRCTSCPGGTHSRSTGASSCTPCNPGQTSSANKTSCEDCPEGHANDVEGGNCEPCPAGQTSSADKTSCEDCPRGHISVEGGSCTPCPVGNISEGEGVSICTQCPEGKYQDAMGMSTCKECPEGTTSNTSRSECICTQPNVLNHEKTKCIECTGEIRDGKCISFYELFS